MIAPIYVFGHKNPDTDSICSSIGYAYLKNALYPQERFQAMRLGDMSQETTFVLNSFGVQTPELLTDVRTQVSDITLKPVPLISPGVSLQEAWELLNEYETHTLPLSEDGRKLSGLITVGGIASAYMALHDPNILHLADTPLENLLLVLKAEILYLVVDDQAVKGRVLVGAMHPDQMGAHIQPGDLIIMGNREKSQAIAIENHAKMLILTGGAALNADILKKAKAYGCTLLRSPLDTFAVARAIFNALPVRHFMKTLPITYFELDDYLDDVKVTMTQKRYRNFPVFDEMHNYVGMISRIQLLRPQRKRVILVDHNELSQTVEGIKEAELLEIIDHHRIGGFQTAAPVYFRNQPMGCTATIIAQLYFENQISVPKDIAGVLTAAILSDTLIFRSPTCTTTDRDMAEKLAKIAEINCEEFGKIMFKAGSNLLRMTPQEILFQDFKVFSTGGIRFGVGQVSAMEEDILTSVEEKIKEEVKSVQMYQDFDMVLFMLTHIPTETTHLLVEGNQMHIIEEAFGRVDSDGSIHLQGLVSRKKQLIPALIQAIEENGAK